MTRARSILAIVIVAIALVLLGAIFWHAQHRAIHVQHSATVVTPTLASNGNDASSITLWAHNIRLRKGPHFHVYIVWIRGLMLRTRPDTIPSLDAPDSFIFDIQKGVIHVNIGDLANYLNAVSASDAPLKEITIQPEGEQLRVRGTLKKAISLPVEVLGSLSPLPSGEICFHTSKISVLKIPMKGLLGLLHIRVDDLVPNTHIPGIRVADNDIIFDTNRILPPPHIRGQLTTIRIRVPDIEAVYGNAGNDETSLAQWHNFLRLSGGTLNLGALTMHHADLTMIDVDDTPWFGLDLANYQSQLTRGYARITTGTGIEAYMPDLDQHGTPIVPPPVSIETLRNRNNPIPGQVKK